MKCKNCGADLLDTDKFCNQCGQKVEEKTRCPECGEKLREGTRFCPKCGRMVGEGDPSDGTVFVKETETSDMPIADIEQNIVSMTEREMRISDKDKKSAAISGVKADRDERAYRPKKAPASEYEVRRTPKPARESEQERNRPKRSVPAPEPKKRQNPALVKKRAYEEWDDDDWDEDEDDDDGGNIMMIVSVCTAFLILAVAAFLIFTLIRKQPIRNYGDSAEDIVEADGDAEEGGETQQGDVSIDDPGDGTEIQETQGSQSAGTLSIVSNVNVRDNPTTEGSNVIKVAKAGETYEYIGTADDDNWYIIILEDGSTGYVFEKYVSVE